MDVYQQLAAHCEQLPVINTHSHFCYPPASAPFGLETLLNQSYVTWLGRFDWRNQRDAALEKVAGTNYFYWLSQGLSALCGVDQPLDAASWQQFDDRVRCLTAQADYQLSVLGGACGYQHILLDPLTPCGYTAAPAPLFTPSYRINQFLYGYSDTARDHNGRHPLLCCKWAGMPDTYQGYVQAVGEQIAKAKARGCVALKSALAYDRDLCFDIVTPKQAAAAYQNPHATAQQIRDFQSGILGEICEFAAQYDMPLQNHTGLGLIDHSRAIHLRPLIAAHPRTTFVLFHASYPWCDDVLALANFFANVQVDLCWLPLLSSARAEAFLSEAIEGIAIHRFSWGCDTQTAFESMGALLAARHMAVNVLSEKVTQKRISVQQAKTALEYIFYRGAKICYPLLPKSPS